MREYKLTAQTPIMKLMLVRNRNYCYVLKHECFEKVQQIRLNCFATDQVWAQAKYLMLSDRCSLNLNNEQTIQIKNAI